MWVALSREPVHPNRKAIDAGREIGEHRAKQKAEASFLRQARVTTAATLAVANF
ncbi:hypothetical protein N185_16355 [Sinorhizobium sp. GW3]|nr:hypothetical protein N185_16355 [Sinorhizobium sp. GW3]